MKKEMKKTLESRTKDCSIRALQDVYRDYIRAYTNVRTGKFEGDVDVLQAYQRIDNYLNDVGK